MREAQLAAEEVRPVRPDPVGLPEDVVRPVEGLHPGVAGAAGVRDDRPPSNRARNACTSFHWALSIASPVVTASAGGRPVAGPRSAFTVRTVASTACGVRASCGRWTGTTPAYRGSAK